MDDWKRLFKPSIAAWFGIISPLCAAIFIGASIALSPWFSWTDNALSDLGVSPVAFIFNSGLVLTGILILIPAISIAILEKENKLGLTGAIMLLIMSISASCAGVFTERYYTLHLVFSMLTFTSLSLSSILLGTRFYLEKETQVLGILALSSAVVSITAVITLNI